MKKQSLLALTLQKLIEESGKSQKTFAEALGVSEQALSQWLHDGALIPPRYIDGIVEIAGRFDETKSVLATFYEIAELPARKVTPFYKKIGENINSYLTKYRVERGLKILLAKTRKKRLLRNEELCRKFDEFVRAVMP